MSNDKFDISPLTEKDKGLLTEENKFDVSPLPIEAFRSTISYDVYIPESKKAGLTALEKTIYTPEQILIERAKNQPWYEQVAKGFGNILPNVFFGLGELAGLVGELGYYGVMKATGQEFKADFSNALTETMIGFKDPFGKVYREDPNDVFDWSDPAWWISNGAGLIESIIEFGITGFGIGSATKAGVNAGVKALQAGVKSAAISRGIAMGGDITATALTAGSLGYLEGGKTGAPVFQQVFDQKYAETGDYDFAIQEASKAASSTVATNTLLIGALSTTAVMPFIMRGGFKNKAAQFGLQKKPNETIKQYLQRMLKTEGAEARTSIIENPKFITAFESVQESAEELANVYAEQAGLQKVGMSEYDETGLELYFKLAGTDEGKLSMMLGALGGAGQTFMMNRMPIYKEKVGDGEVRRVSADYMRKKEMADLGVKYARNIARDLQMSINLQSDLQKAILEGNEAKAEVIKRELFDIYGKRSIKFDEGESAKAFLDELASIDNKTELQEIYQEEIETLEVAREQANEEQVKEIDARIAKLKQLIVEDQGKTQAMKMGLAESKDDNEYKSKVAQKKNEIDELVSDYKNIKSLYSYGDDITEQFVEHLFGLNVSKRRVTDALDYAKEVKQRIEGEIRELRDDEDINPAMVDIYDEQGKLEALESNLEEKKKELANVKENAELLKAKYNEVTTKDLKATLKKYVKNIESKIKEQEQKINSMQDDLVNELADKGMSIKKIKESIDKTKEAYYINDVNKKNIEDAEKQISIAETSIQILNDQIKSITSSKGRKDFLEKSMKSSEEVDKLIDYIAEKEEEEDKIKITENYSRKKKTDPKKSVTKEEHSTFKKTGKPSLSVKKKIARKKLFNQPLSDPEKEINNKFGEDIKKEEENLNTPELQEEIRKRKEYSNLILDDLRKRSSEYVGIDADGNVVDRKDDFAFYGVVDAQGNITNELPRVSSIIGESIDTEWTKTASKFGREADRFVREFFNKGIEDKDLSSYTFASLSDLKKLKTRLKTLKTLFEKNGETVYSEEFVVSSKDNFAGTTDIITIDEQGNFRIYDVKTIRGYSKKIKPLKKDGSKGTPVSSYDFKGYFDKDKNVYIEDESFLSKREKHQKQLSLYSIALENSYGIAPVETFIIPIELDYNKNATQVSEITVRNPIEIDMLTSVTSYTGDATYNMQNISRDFSFPDYTREYFPREIKETDYSNHDNLFVVFKDKKATSSYKIQYGAVRDFIVTEAGRQDASNERKEISLFEDYDESYFEDAEIILVPDTSFSQTIEQDGKKKKVTYSKLRKEGTDNVPIKLVIKKDGKVIDVSASLPTVEWISRQEKGEYVNIGLGTERNPVDIQGEIQRLKDLRKSVVERFEGDETSDTKRFDRAKEIEKRRQKEIEKRTHTPRTREKQFEDSLNDNQEMIFKIGTVLSEGDKISYERILDETSEGFAGEHVTVVIITRKPTILTDGVLSQSGKVDVGLFDSKEAADKWLAKRDEENKERVYKKINEINAKYDAELAAADLESKTSEPISIKVTRITKGSFIKNYKTEDGSFEGELVYERGKPVTEYKPVSTLIPDPSVKVGIVGNGNVIINIDKKKKPEYARKENGDYVSVPYKRGTVVLFIEDSTVAVKIGNISETDKNTIKEAILAKVNNDEELIDKINKVSAGSKLSRDQRFSFKAEDGLFNLIKRHVFSKSFTTTDLELEPERYFIHASPKENKFYIGGNKKILTNDEFFIGKSLRGVTYLDINENLDLFDEMLSKINVSVKSEYINSDKKYENIVIEDGEVSVSKSKTYNEHIKDSLLTYLNGRNISQRTGKYVYREQPIVYFSLDSQLTEIVNDDVSEEAEKKKKESIKFDENGNPVITSIGDLFGGLSFPRVEEEESNLTEEQLKLLENNLIGDFTDSQVNEAKMSILFLIKKIMDAYNEKGIDADYKKTFEAVQVALSNEAESNSNEIIAEKLKLISSTHWDKFKDLAESYLRDIGIKKTTSVSFETEESNFEKRKFDQSFTEDEFERANAIVKLELSFIPKTEYVDDTRTQRTRVKNFLGLNSFVPLKDLFSRVRQTLNGVDPSIESMVYAMETSKDPNVIEVANIIKNKGLDSYFTNNFFIALNMQKINSYTVYLKTVNNVIRTYPGRTDASDERTMTINGFSQNMISNSPFVKKDKEGDFIIDVDKVQEMKDKYEKVMGLNPKTGYYKNVSNNVALDMFSELLSYIGIDLSRDDLKNYIPKGTYFGQNLSSLIRLENKDSLVNNIFKYLLGDQEVTQESDDETDVRTDKPYYTLRSPLLEYSLKNDFKSLARAYIEKNGHKFSDSHSDINNNIIYPWQKPSFLYDKIIELRDEEYVDKIRELHLLRKSRLLDRMEDVDYFYVNGLSNIEANFSREMSKLDEIDLHLINMAFFFGRASQTKGERGMFAFQKSDKQTVPILDVPIDNYTYNKSDYDSETETISSLDELAQTALTEYAIAEYEKIIDGYTKEKGMSDNDPYKEGYKYFYMFPFLNYDSFVEFVENGVITESEFALVYKSKDRLSLDMESALPVIQKLINYYFTNEVNETRQLLEDVGLIGKKRFFEFNGQRTYTIGKTFIDSNYLKNVSKKQGSGPKIMDAVYNFVINNAINESENMILFGGDPAYYYKNDIATTLDVYRKRSSKDIAPRSPGNVRNKEVKISRIVVKDLFASLDIESLPDSYKKDGIDITDGSQFSTVSFRIDFLERTGKIEPEEADRLRGIIKPGKYYEFSEEDAKKYFGPLKDIYTGSEIDTNLNSLRPIFTKDATFVLLPQILKYKDGSITNIDMLRKMMEEENINLASMGSAAKTGKVIELNVLDSRGRFNESIERSDIVDAIQYLDPRKYGIQQEESIENKNKVNIITQVDTLIMSGLRNVEGFEYMGKKFNGRELERHKDSIIGEIYESRKNAIYKRLGIEEVDGIPIITDFSKIQEALKRGAELNNWSPQSVDTIRLSEDKQSFIVPQDLSVKSDTIQNLFYASLSDIGRIKMEGFAGVQAPFVLIDSTSKEEKEEQKEEKKETKQPEPKPEVKPVKDNKEQVVHIPTGRFGITSGAIDENTVEVTYDNGDVEPVSKSELRVKTEDDVSPVVKKEQPSVDLGSETAPSVGNVIIDSVKGRSPQPGAVVAFRTKGKTEQNMIDALSDNVVGNPFGPYAAIKTKADGEAVTRFLNWLEGTGDTNVMQDYRSALLAKVPELKGKPIYYYKNLGRPSHATALDFFLNKPTAQPEAEFKIEVITKKYSRDSLDKDPNSMYLFTDNAERTSRPKASSPNITEGWYAEKYKDKTDKPLHYGSKSNPTSAVIRGKNNAYPISTMSAYGTDWVKPKVVNGKKTFEGVPVPSKTMAKFKETIDDEINQIKKDLSKFDTLKIGNFRIGQGGRYARLHPELQDYLDSKLLEIGIDNSGETPTIVQPETGVKEGVPDIIIKGIEINSKQTGLGNDLTNVHYATNGKSKFDIKPSDSSLTLTPEAKKTWGESVEAWYKSNNAKVKGIPEGAEGDAYDMKLMIGLITDKLRQYPNLVSEITNRGGLQFLEKSTHTMGNGRWSSNNPKNMFMNALKQAYQNVTQKQGGVTNNPAEFTNHSGGAKGYDAEWDLIGAEFGMVNNKHYLLPSDGSVSDPRLRAKGVKPVDATDDVGPVALRGPATGEAQIAVTNAERVMGRIKSNHTTRNTKKIRNYAQVKNADGIFAIGSLIPKGAEITVARGKATKKALVPQVNGGTSVAVQLGITMGKPTYVFNQVANNTYSQGWYKWDDTKKDFVSIDTPTLTKNFAGIGTSSNTTEAGKQAIRDVYEKTFTKTQPSVKAGVSELFETNTELANAVYEALGFDKIASIPEYTVNRELVNKDGSKRLASTNGNQISINPVSSIEEFFDYFTGKEGGISSKQKNKVLSKLKKEGYNLDRIKQILRDKKTINTFLILHEQDHIDNNDIDVYWKSGKDLLTEDKIEIETRAILNALKKLENELTLEQKQQAQELYSQYLDTIFPDSKVKDIVYHGSNQEIEQFEIRKEPLIHFGTKSAALQRGNVLNAVLLNIKDLQTIKDGMWFLGTDEGGLLKELLDRNILTIEEVRIINEAKDKAIRQSPYFNENYRMALPEGEKAGNKKLQEILQNKNIGFEYVNFSEDKGSTSFAVPSQKQIYRLGSEQDIEGFKEFVNEPEVDQGQLFLFSPVTRKDNIQSQNYFQINSLFNNINLFSNINIVVKSIGSNKKLNNYLKRKGIDSNFRKQFIKLVNDHPKLKNLKVSEVLSSFSNEFIKDSDRQYYKAISEPLNKELENVIRDYFSKFNITEKEINNLKEKFGVDTVGVFDVLSKTLYYTENRNSLTIPEEYGHVFVELLGSIHNRKAENPIFKKLFQEVEKWDGYQRVFNQYKDVYQTSEGNIDIYKIKKEAIGQAIGIGLVRNFNAKKGDSFWKSVQKAIDYILELFAGISYKNFNTLVDDIAKDILNKNYSKLNRLSKDTSNYNLLSYSETIKEQNKKDGGLALSFMEWYSNLGAIITGSLAYRQQGTVYRPAIDALHDIDLIIPSDVHNINLNKSNYLSPEELENDRLYRKYIAERNYKKAKEYKVSGNLRLDIDNITEKPFFKKIKEKYPDLDWLYTFYNQKANAYYITVNGIWSKNKELKDRFKSYKGSFNSRLENFTKEEIEQIYLFDYFLRPEKIDDYVKVEDPEYNLNLAHFNYSFYEKLNMMGRDKDVFDYQNWEFYNPENTLEPDFNDRLVYFQLQNNPNYQLSLIKEGRQQDMFENPVVAYQGYTKLDERKYNYFTQNQKEAEQYGPNVRTVVIDTAGFFKRTPDNYDEYSRILAEFYNETQEGFDILDNSKEGLRKQKMFFDFLESKGYKGYSMEGFEDSSTYYVAFEPSSFYDFDEATQRSKMRVFEEQAVTNTNIVFTRKYNKERGLDFVEKGKEGESNKPAQIIVTWNFKGSNGKLLNIDDFLDEDGFIDFEKLPEEVLRGIAARIPNQGHSSMMPFEIVGFLPTSVHNTIIVPNGITLQMGSDFDIDKLYGYLQNYYYDYKSSNIKSFKIESDINDHAAVYDELFGKVKSRTAASKIRKAATKFNKDFLNERSINQYLEDELFDVLTTKQIAVLSELAEDYLMGDSRLPLNFYTLLPKKQEFIDKRTAAGELDGLYKFLPSKMLRQLYFEIHKSVLDNPEVFDKIVDPLENNDIATEKKIIGKKTGELRSIPRSPLSYIDKVSQMSKKWAGADLVGISAIGLTMNAVIEDKNIELVRESKKSSTPYTIDIMIGDKLVSMTKISGEGISEYDGEKRTKQDNLKSLVSTSVDNPNLDEAGYVGFNPYTASVGIIMTYLQSENNIAAGLDSTLRFLSQDIIKDYIKRMSYLNWSGNNRYSADKIKTVIRELKQDYARKILIEEAKGVKETKNITEETFDKYFNKDDVAEVIRYSSEGPIPNAATLYKYINGLKNEKIDIVEYYKHQILIINKFDIMQDIAEELIPVRKGILNPFVNKLPSNIFALQELQDNIDKISAGSKLLSNLDRLIKDEKGTLTKEGHFIDKVVNPAISLSSYMFPIVTKIMPKIEASYVNDFFMGKDIISERERKNIWKAFTNYIWQNTKAFGLGDPNKLRKYLMYDFPVEFERIKKEPWAANNIFLSKIQVKISDKADQPSKIFFPATKSNDVGDYDILFSIASLFKNKNPKARETIENLYKYSMMTGAVYSPISYFHLLPSAWFEEEFTGIFNKISEVTNNDESINVEYFIYQMLRNNTYMIQTYFGDLSKTFIRKKYDKNEVESGLILPDPDDKDYIRDLKSNTGYTKMFKIITKKGEDIYQFDGIYTDETTGKVTWHYNKVSKLNNGYVSQYDFNEKMPPSFFNGEASYKNTASVLDSNQRKPESGSPSSTELQYGKNLVESYLPPSMSAKDAINNSLDVIQDNAYYKELASIMKEALKGKRVQVKSNTTIPSYGGYSGNTLFVNPLLIGKDTLPKESFEKVLLHEYGHAITKNLIDIYNDPRRRSQELTDKQINLIKSLENVYNAVKKNVIEGNEEAFEAFLERLSKQEKSLIGIRESELDFYNVQSFSEFASAIWDEKFQEKLNSIDYDSRITFKDRIVNILKKLFDALAQSFGIKVRDKSALKEAIGIVVDLTLTQEQELSKAQDIDPETGDIISGGGLGAIFGSKSNFFARQANPAIEGIISQTEFTLSDIRLALSGEKNPESRLNLINILNLYENKLSEILNVTSAKGLLEFGKQQLEIAEDIINNPDSSDKEYLVAMSIIDSWDFDKTSSFLKDNQKREENPWYKAFSVIDGIRNRKKGRMLNRFRNIIAKSINERFDLEEKVRPQDLTELKEISSVYNLVDASIAPLPILQYLNTITRNEQNKVNAKLQAFTDELKEKIRLLVPDGNFEFMFQKDSDGNDTKRIVHEYTYEYDSKMSDILSELHKSFEIAEGLVPEEKRQFINKSVRDFNRKLNEINEYLDIRYFVEGTKQYAQKDSYISSLEKRYGKKNADRFIQAAEEKYQQYLLDREGYIMLLKNTVMNSPVESLEDIRESEKENTDIYVNRKIKDWEALNSPERALFEMKANLKKAYYVNKNGRNYLSYFPKKEIEGKPTNFYNEEFDKMTSDQKEWIEFFSNFIATFIKPFPNNVKNQIPNNFYPAVIEEATFKILSRGLGKFLDKKIIDKFTDSPVSFEKFVGAEDKAEERRFKRQERLGTTRNLIRFIDPKNRVDPQNVSKNVELVMLKFAEMSLLYEHMNNIEAEASIINRVIQEADEVDLEGNLKRKSESLMNIKKQAEHIIKSNIYSNKSDESTPTNVRLMPGSVLNFVGINTKENRKKKKRLKEIKKEYIQLETQFDSNEISISDYNKKLEALEIEYNSIGGRSLVTTKILQSALELNQIKHMGWNFRAGIANIGFGIVSMYTWAAGDNEFGTKEANQALGIMLKSGFSRNNLKISKIVKKLNVLFEVRDVTFGRGNAKLQTNRSNLKFISSYLNAYQIQRSTEYAVQGMSAVAQMLKTKVTVTKKSDGTTEEIPLFYALNDNGDWNTDLYEENKDWGYIEGEKMSQFRNQVIKTNYYLYGNYDPNNMPIYKRSVYMRAIGQFRSWIPYGFAQRFIPTYYDPDLGRYFTGRYITYSNVGAINSIKAMTQLLFKDPEKVQQSFDGEITMDDIKNLKMNLRELLIFIGLNVAGLLIMSSLPDDDEEETAYTYTAQVLLNQLYRIEQDIYFYINPATAEDILRNPVPVFKLYIDGINAVNSSLEYLVDPESYEKDHPAWKFMKATPGANQVVNLVYSANNSYEDK